MKAEVIPERIILMKKKIVWTVILSALVLVSLYLSKTWGSVSFNEGRIAYLDNKKLTVTGLVATVSAASTAIAAVPGDATTPIATQLASTTSWLLMVTVVIIAEKYLLTILIHLSLTWLFPIALGIFIACVWIDSAFWRKLAIKLCIFAAAIALVVPASVGASRLIESTYQDSIKESMNAISENSDSTDKTEEKKDFWSTITSTVETLSTEALETLKTQVSNFIDAVAVLVVTSCIIPILVLIAFSWIIKLLFGIAIDVPDKLTHPKMKFLGAVQKQQNSEE